MAEISLTINGASGFIPAWGAVSFDHAALVTAGRSRADGLDFYMRHTVSTEPVWIKGRTGLNTATATVTFCAITNGVDANYRLGFGDLGAQVDRAGGGAAAASGSVTSASVPELTLPAPSHALTAVKRYRRAESAGGGVYRRRDLNENPQWVYLPAWRNIPPEDWYEIRAWVAASRGGAGIGSFAWASGNYRPLPGTLSLTKDSAGEYHAGLELEEAVA